MSVSVYIDGQPAERSEAYFEVLRKVGGVPMSRRTALNYGLPRTGLCYTSVAVAAN
jgi:hypothetical protein